MKKRIITIALVIALLATCFAGTYAYLTDTEAVKNVMAVGDVEIEQFEVERTENGGWQTFTQDTKYAYPAVGTIAWAAEPISVGGGDQKVFHEGLKNVIDKFVYVKNTGNTDAYVRTIIAIEAPGFDANDWIHINHNDSNGVTVSNPYCVTVKGTQYVVFVYTYNTALASNTETPVSLAQLFLDAAATNEFCAAFNGTWEVLALSQAVQAAGFDAPTAALDAAFGEVSNANLIEWLETVG